MEYLIPPAPVAEFAFSEWADDSMIDMRMPVEPCPICGAINQTCT